MFWPSEISANGFHSFKSRRSEMLPANLPRMLSFEEEMNCQAELPGISGCQLYLIETLYVLTENNHDGFLIHRVSCGIDSKSGQVDVKTKWIRIFFLGVPSPHPTPTPTIGIYPSHSTAVSITPTPTHNLMGNGGGGGGIEKAIKYI